MSKRRKQSRGPGGWPRRETGQPTPASKARQPTGKDNILARELRRLGPREAVGPLAFLGLADQLAHGSVDEQTFQGYLKDLRRLLTTSEKLAAIRPSRRRLGEAFHEFFAANPDMRHAEPLDEASRHEFYAYVVPRVFDEPLIDRLDEELMGALVDTRSSRDAHALSAGLMCIAQARACKGPLETNPLFELLVNLSITETTHFEGVLRDIGFPLAPEQIEELVNNPAELDKVIHDADISRKLGERMEKDPVLRRKGMEAMFEGQELFSHAVADGTIGPHLNAEQLAPVAHALNTLIARLGIDDTTTEPPEELMRGAIDIYREHANDPANHPGFERFTSEFRAQAEQAVADGSPQAARLKTLSDVWGGLWREDERFRVHLVHGSIRRIAHEIADKAEAQHPEESP